MSSVHCVVVWEWHSNGDWLPHTPAVTRTLERAHAKKLTRVVLADADPALKGYYVNLRTLMQCVDTSDGGSLECRVRRACYSVQSPAGRGARWEWARFVSPPVAGELNYEPLPMEVQCLIEESWSGSMEAVSYEGWVLCPARMTARPREGRALRLLRRAPHPPYPLTRPANYQQQNHLQQQQNHLQQQQNHHHHQQNHHHHQQNHHQQQQNHHQQQQNHHQQQQNHHQHQQNHQQQHQQPDSRRGRIPQQHTGSSVQSAQSAQSAPATWSQPAARGGGARSASPRERKPGLARQILHNLNIFSNNSKQTSHADSRQRAEAEADAEEQSQQAEAECAGSRSGRRHSVDTVSTYLSHESKESLQQGSVGSLLNCSASSDEAFDPPPPLPPPPPPPPPPPTLSNELPLDDDGLGGLSWVGCEGAGAEAGWAAARGWVRAEARPQWGAVCPACLRALEPAGPAVALTRCQHLMHLHCLDAALRAQRDAQKPLCISCLVCGQAYGREEGAEGSQPPGSMAWSLQPTPLPQHPHCSASILVTYNFESGRQGPLHPAPGAPYYAVGFPRYSLLPDTPLGRQVLNALRCAWERRLLFGVCASQTTGREHVVAWRAVPPPPSDSAQYAPPARPHALLAAALRRLLALTHADRQHLHA